MTSAQWLAHFSNSAVSAKIAADPVLPIYPSIANWFASCRPLGWDDCVCGMHMVYGWMPTMLKLKRTAACTAADRAQVVLLFNKARSSDLSPAELAWLKAKFINNSMVGLSKMLHFIEPQRYAMWDSRVAKNWYPRYSYNLLKKPNEYLTYISDLRTWRTAGHPVKATMSLVRGLSPHLALVTEMRLMEIVMFHA